MNNSNSEFKGLDSLNDKSPQRDPNEFSGILSSPGLCGNNSLLEKQDDVMNDFMKNLQRKIDEDQESNKNLNLAQKSSATEHVANDQNILQSSGILKQSQFSDQEENKQMSQLG